MNLNEDFEFASVTRDHQRAFPGGNAVKIKLDSGTQLYKLTEHLLLHRGKVSPWWSAVKPIDAQDTGLATLLERASRLGVSPNHFSRTRNGREKGTDEKRGRG